MSDQSKVVLLTSQTFLDVGIIVEKVQQNETLSATVSAEFVIDGQYYRMILDGHHAIRAHQISGKPLVFTEVEKGNSDSVTAIKGSSFRVFFTTNRSEFQEGI